MRNDAERFLGLVPKKLGIPFNQEVPTVSIGYSLNIEGLTVVLGAYGKVKYFTILLFGCITAENHVLEI